jgi:hypothetical protein
MPVPSQVAITRGRYAALSRCVKNGERSADELAEARDDLAEARALNFLEKATTAVSPLSDERRTRLAEHAQRVIAGWPPPTDEQLARVAALLAAGGGGAG